MELDPQNVRLVAASYRLSQLVYAVAILGIPDVLASGPRTANSIASAIGADSARVHRLVRAAASEGVLGYEDGAYAVNAFSRRLTSDSADSVRDMVVGWSALRTGYLGFAYLPEAITQGRSGVELAVGEPFYSHLKGHPDEAARYDAATNSTVDGFRAAAAAYDFSQHATVIDVGGGLGAFLVAIIEAHPRVRGVLYELPQVAQSARRFLADLPQAARIEVVGGDMFTTIPSGGDAYVFSTVLRCFDDDDCLRVLRVCAESMPAGAHLLAMEMVLPEGIPPSPSGLADLQALVVYGGKDRTEREWTDLLLRAGYASPVFRDLDPPYVLVDACSPAT